MSFSRIITSRLPTVAITAARHLARAAVRASGRTFQAQTAASALVKHVPKNEQHHGNNGSWKKPATVMNNSAFAALAAASYVALKGTSEKQEASEAQKFSNELKGFALTTTRWKLVLDQREKQLNQLKHTVRNLPNFQPEQLSTTVEKVRCQQVVSQARGNLKAIFKEIEGAEQFHPEVRTILFGLQAIERTAQFLNRLEGGQDGAASPLLHAGPLLQQLWSKQSPEWHAIKAQVEGVGKEYAELHSRMQLIETDYALYFAMMRHLTNEIYNK